MSKHWRVPVGIWLLFFGVVVFHLHFSGFCFSSFLVSEGWQEAWWPSHPSYHEAFSGTKWWKTPRWAWGEQVRGILIDTFSLQCSDTVGLAKGRASSMQKDQLSTGQMSFLLPNQQRQSSEGGMYHIPWTCLPQAQLGVFQLCLWPLIAPGYLGEGCHASHQPSDAGTPVKNLALVRMHRIPASELVVNSPSNTVSYERPKIVPTRFTSFGE